jgi:hypothetical protein
VTERLRRRMAYGRRGLLQFLRTTAARRTPTNDSAP